MRTRPSWQHVISLPSNHVVMVTTIMVVVTVITTIRRRIRATMVTTVGANREISSGGIIGIPALMHKGVHVGVITIPIMLIGIRPPSTIIWGTGGLRPWFWVLHRVWSATSVGSKAILSVIVRSLVTVVVGVRDPVAGQAGSHVGQPTWSLT